MSKLDDRLTAQEVELLCDKNGKVWVNVDGICVLRVGHVERVVIDNKRTMKEE